MFQVKLVQQNGKSCRRSLDRPSMDMHQPIPNYKSISYCRDPESRQKARYIDKMSRKMFPLAFLSFNLIYWLSYILA